MTRAAAALAALMMATAWGGRALAEDQKADGARVYKERCASCHGDEGNGDGPIAWAIEPKPRNFADATFWKERTPAQLREVVKKGKAGTQMGAFEGVLSDAEIDAVVAFIETFKPPGKAARARSRGDQVSRAGDDEDAAGSRDRCGGGS